jgi:hypothetical protein
MVVYPKVFVCYYWYTTQKVEKPLPRKERLNPKMGNEETFCVVAEVVIVARLWLLIVIAYWFQMKLHWLYTVGMHLDQRQQNANTQSGSVLSVSVSKSDQI